MTEQITNPKSEKVCVAVFGGEVCGLPMHWPAHSCDVARFGSHCPPCNEAPHGRSPFCHPFTSGEETASSKDEPDVELSVPTDDEIETAAKFVAEIFARYGWKWHSLKSLGESVVPDLDRIKERLRDDIESCKTIDWTMSGRLLVRRLYWRDDDAEIEMYLRLPTKPNEVVPSAVSEPKPESARSRATADEPDVELSVPTDDEIETAAKFVAEIFARYGWKWHSLLSTVETCDCGHSFEGCEGKPIALWFDPKDESENDEPTPWLLCESCMSACTGAAREESR